MKAAREAGEITQNKFEPRLAFMYIKTTGSTGGFDVFPTLWNRRNATSEIGGRSVGAANRNAGFSVFSRRSGGGIGGRVLPGGPHLASVLLSVPTGLAAAHAAHTAGAGL